MAEPLTERQRQVFDAIRRFMTEHRVPPTVRQIGELVGLRSTASVQRVLDVLAVKGWITRQKGAYRTLNPMSAEEEGVLQPCIPLAGNVAAGLPREAVEELSTTAVSFPGTRCLQVTGNAFFEYEILSGDRLHVEPLAHGQTPPTRGQVLCRKNEAYHLVAAQKLGEQPWDFVFGRLVAVTRPLH